MQVLISVLILINCLYAQTPYEIIRRSEEKIKGKTSYGVIEMIEGLWFSCFKLGGNHARV